MSREVRSQRRSPTKGKLIRTAVVLSIVAVGVPLALSQLGSTAGARFGASDTLGPNQLASATLSVRPGQGTVSLTVGDMTPGDQARGRIDLVNDGSLPLRYALESSVTPASTSGKALADELDLEVWRAVTCGDAPPTSASVLAPLQPLGTATYLFGDPATGQQLGDQAIPVGGSDTICYRVSLPIDAPNTAQSQTIEQSFIVHAEHALPSEGSP